METNGDFSLLPEDCISKVVSFTGPRDACRLSLVSPSFKSAAESDAVWNRFLPSDYQVLISRSGSPTSVCYRLKKELYLSLCDKPLLIDDGTKSFFLDKLTGKKCYMLSARDLVVVWGENHKYWKWTSLPESRFKEVAKLRSVCWLEIRGEINTNMLSAGTHYAVYFVFTKTSKACGFRGQPIEARVGFSGGVDDHKQTVCLTTEKEYTELEQRRVYQVGHNQFIDDVRLRPSPVEGESSERQYMKDRGDGWFEVELGDFFNFGGDDGELEMSISEVKGGHWKKGLIVEGIEIRPKTRTYMINRRTKFDARAYYV